MARISLVEEKDHPELAEVIDKIKAGRRGALLNIYKLLLHAPPLAATWSRRQRPATKPNPAW